MRLQKPQTILKQILQLNIYSEIYENWSFELWILTTRQYGNMFKSCCCNEEDIIIIITVDIMVVFENT